jgi:hypothetical protein
VKPNKIINWSSSLPTEPGLYLACLNEMGTITQPMLVSFRNENQRGLIDQNGGSIEKYTRAYKWALLSFS